VVVMMVVFLRDLASEILLAMFSSIFFASQPRLRLVSIFANEILLDRPIARQSR